MELFCLGSCRAIGPFKYLDRTKKVVFFNKEYCWYGHNTQEFIQRIEYLYNKSLIPDEMRSLIMDADSCHSDYDAFHLIGKLPYTGVFEISTRVIKQINSYTLHSTCISKRGLKSYDEYIQSFEDLESDIIRLGGYFNKLFIICNIEYDEDLKRIHPHRKKLNEFITGLESKHDNIRALDPNQLIRKFSDPGAVLEDNNHFKSDFITKVADFYFDKMSLSFKG